jgi:hypothetical protein
MINRLGRQPDEQVATQRSELDPIGGTTGAWI